jgi:phage antirepressor YoqD-like protein
MYDLTMRVKELEEQNSHMQPKALFYDTVASSKDAIDMSTVAKVLDLGIGRNKLFAFLRAEKILMHNNIPYQQFIDRGYFRVIETHHTLPDGSVKIKFKTLVFQTGLDYINNKHNNKKRG